MHIDVDIELSKIKACIYPGNIIFSMDFDKLHITLNVVYRDTFTSEEAGHNL